MKELERMRRWRLKNIARENARSLNYYYENRERSLERMRQWRAENKGRRLTWMIAGEKRSVYVPTVGDKERLAAMIAAHRAEQQAEYAQFKATLKEA